MNLALRKRILPSASAFGPSLPPPAAHHNRSGGLGDFIFMEPALRKLKAQEPRRKLILHAPEKYRAIHKLIGYDGFEPNETGKCVGDGLDLHWTLERHPGWYCLDRVSIWEDILGVPVGGEPVELDVDKKHSVLGTNILREKPWLAFLPFASNAGTSGRSLPLDHVVTLASALSEYYTVIIPSSVCLPGIIEDCNAVWAHTRDTAEFIATVASCDKCLGVDSGGIYVAAAAGVPTVGLYSHVDPWLRIPRFPMLYGLDLRGPTCQCEQHGTCSRPVRNECPCKYVAPEKVLWALEQPNRYQKERYGPKIAVAVEGGGEQCSRATFFSLEYALARQKWGWAQFCTESEFTLTLKDGDLIPRHVFLQALSDLRQPGYNQKPCPIDLKRTRRDS